MSATLKMLVLLIVTGGLIVICMQDASAVEVGARGIYTDLGIGDDIGYGAIVDISIVDNLAVRLGVDQFDFENDMSYGANFFSSDYYEYTEKIDITLLSVSLYYDFTGDKPVDFYVGAGFDYYINDLEAEMTVNGEDRSSDYSSDIDNSFGYHVGLGVNIPLAGKVSLVTEGKFQWASLDYEISLNEPSGPLSRDRRWVEGDNNGVSVSLGILVAL